MVLVCDCAQKPVKDTLAYPLVYMRREWMLDQGPGKRLNDLVSEISLQSALADLPPRGQILEKVGQTQSSVIITEGHAKRPASKLRL